MISIMELGLHFQSFILKQVSIDWFLLDLTVVCLDTIDLLDSLDL